MMRASILVLGVAAALSAWHPSSRPHLAIGRSTRLLVVAPHPDDETLGAGGLMQRVLAGGGDAAVVYLTNGDGYPEGVRVEDHIASPTARDYRGYGDKREREARAALSILHIRPAHATFLGFPDGGLSTLMTRYWSERRAAFRSPYTRLDRPPKSETIVPDTEYRGEDLSQELAQLIGRQRPTLILVPRKEDQHADHCASWFFVKDALGDVQRVAPDYAPDLVNYIVHWYGWPFDDEDARLGPPPGLLGGTSGWISVPLSVQQQRAKREALMRYATQVHVMDWFLDGFTRANEIFSRPAPSRVTLPLRRNRNPCGE
jgi:LmbE family N-acetylglucosaminyl deacetylase